MGFDTLLTRVRKKREIIGSTRQKKEPERSKTGFEVEFLLVDNDGRISTDADRVLKYAENMPNKGKEIVVKECSLSHIEMGVYPRIYVRNVALEFMNDMLHVLEAAEHFDLRFFPLAMYPYKYEPAMRTEGWYGLKKKIFGRKKWNYAGMCAGFHFHYSLPKGIFSYEDRHLVDHALRSEKQKTLNSYNLAIAADPVVTALTQSSPIFQGRYLAKDSRLLVYRGGDALNYEGLYSSYPMFGALPNYKITYEELLDLVEKRARIWKSIVREKGGDTKDLASKNKLDFNWSPVKINKVGSIEMRGMDMNLPSVLMAVAILMKYVLRGIQRREIMVVPDSLAIKHPFKYEGDPDRIYVPPFWYLSTVLQREAAWNGFDSQRVYDYCREFLSLSMKFVNPKYVPALRPVQRMLRKRKTTSDHILDMIRKRGYTTKAELPENILREIVLYYSSRLKSDIINTRDLMGSLSEGDRRWL